MKVSLTASRHILPIARFLTNHGEPLQPLLRGAGLPITCLEDPSRLVPTAALWRFRELAATQTGSPNLTLAAMEPLDLLELGPVGQSLRGAPTLLRTIQDFRRLAHTESSTAHLDLRPRPNGDVFFSVWFSLGRRPDQWQGDLYLLTWMLKIVRLVDPAWSPVEISCIASATADRLTAIESLGARPRFHHGCTGFSIPASMLALPPHGRGPGGRSPSADEANLWSRAPSPSASGALKQLIRAYAGDNWLTLQEASDALGLSPRTLQRELAEEGQTYSAIFESTRAEVAANLLEETENSLSEIARSLGYSNLSNFNRAFRRWAGVPPRQFRARAQRKAVLRAPSPTIVQQRKAPRASHLVPITGHFTTAP